MKSVPACYLLGLVAGKKASAKGVKDAVLYNGLSPFIKSSRIAAFMKGARDGGVQIPVSEDALPPEGRLSGEIIAKYASALLKDDKGAYQKRFSSLLRGGFKPEDYPAHFEETKRAILGGSKR